MASTAPTKPFTIALIGGGISGVVLALALQRKNIPIIIYEAASEFGEIGAGVSFGPNAQAAMQRISPDVTRGFEKCVTKNQWESKRDLWFDFRLGDARFGGKEGGANGEDGGKAEGEGKGEGERLKGGDLFHALPCPTGQASVHRAHFLDEMTKLLVGDVARMGKRVVDAKTLENGDVELHFQDGSTATHDAVIACDGIKSRVREVVLGKDHPAAKAVYSGKYAYRGLIPMDKARELLGDELAMNSQLYSGYGGHVLTFSIEKGKTMNVVAFSSSREWTNPSWIAPFSKSDMYADFTTWSPHVQSILHLMSKSDIWALFNHPSAPSYSSARICLLGDAAHASTPHQGAGAGMCVEDAYVMSELLALAKTKGDLEGVFEVFDEVRRPRTQRLVETSRQAGMLYDFEMEGVGDDLERYRREMDVRMKWIWEHDLDGEVEGAKKMVEERLGAKA